MNRSAARMFRCNAAEINRPAPPRVVPSQPSGWLAISRARLPDSDSLCHRRREPIRSGIFLESGRHAPCRGLFRISGDRGRAELRELSFVSTTSPTAREWKWNFATPRNWRRSGGLAAGIAHEINTPIQFMGDNTRFLQESFRESTEMHRRSMKRSAKRRGTAPCPHELLEDVQEIRKRIDWDYLRVESAKGHGPNARRN